LFKNFGVNSGLPDIQGVSKNYDKADALSIASRVRPLFLDRVVFRLSLKSLIESTFNAFLQAKKRFLLTHSCIQKQTRTPLDQILSDANFHCQNFLEHSVLKKQHYANFPSLFRSPVNI
jgi:hypothetical protein